MAEAITMPQMGFEMLEGTVVAWLKREGESVRTGEPIAEVETDKAVVELEAPATGTLLRIAVPEGGMAAIGTPLAFIGAPGEKVPPVGVRSHDKPHASSIAVRIAADHGIELATVKGTGPGNRITKEDVLKVIETLPDTAGGLRAGFPPRQPDTNGRIALGPMGEAIARRTEATMRDVPHFYESVLIDMTSALEYRRELNTTLDGESRVSVNDLIVRACTLTLLRHPVFNSTFEGDHLQVQSHVNIGMAVAMQNGLMVPAVVGCETMSLSELALATKDVVARAKDGKLRQAEYTGTFTISNLGTHGVDQFTAVIVRPQVAVLSVGAIKPTPLVVGKDVVARQAMNVTLGSDHRAIQGAEAAQFLADLKRLLQDPRSLGE